MPEFLITLAAGAIGFIMARNFVRRRLRFVDAVQSFWAPIIAGAFAAMLAWPVTLLPLISLTTAIVFGIGAGWGTASGAKALRRQGGARGHLTP